MRKLSVFFSLALVLSFCAQAQDVRDINVNMSREWGRLDKKFKECVGSGHAQIGLRADWQEQLRMTKEECDFKYIRFHGIFHDDMGVYYEDKDGNPSYNWMYVDHLYDFLLSIDMKPFVELSFTPKALASGDKTIFQWKGNVTPPKSYKKYHDFIKAFAQHLTDRYGEEEIKTWYFEVWNEPNHHSFFAGSRWDYLKMYGEASKAIKSVNKDYRVGGPSTAGSGWIKETINYCRDNKIEIDFVSGHSYGCHGFLDEFGVASTEMGSNPDCVAGTGAGMRNTVRKYSPEKDLEVHITEWSTSYSPRDPVHDTYQNATFVLNTLRKSKTGDANSLSYWVFTDIFEEDNLPRTPFHGRFGMLNADGIKKPTYHAYRYMNQLGDIELRNNDKASWACKDGDDLQILFYDFRLLDDKGKSNQIFYRKKHPSKKISTVNINAEGLKDGKYALKVFQTGYEHNDAFSAYYDMGLPNQLSRAQTAYLKELTNDRPIEEQTVEVKDGKFVKSFDLRENDIFLVKLEKL